MNLAEIMARTMQIGSAGTIIGRITLPEFRAFAFATTRSLTALNLKGVDYAYVGVGPKARDMERSVGQA